MSRGPKFQVSAGVEAELYNEEGVMQEGGDSDVVGDEAGNDAVGSRCKGAIPVSDRGDVTAQKVGYLLDEALREESESGVSVGYGGGHGGDACLDVNQCWVLKYSLAKAGWN